MQSPSLILLLACAKGKLAFSPVLSSDSGAADETCSFGFIKYHNYEDAENCIRGFYYRKYEAKYARVRPSPWLERSFTDKPQVGHNERLKTLANPNNTNLYLSNLPKHMNEAVGHASTISFP